MVIEPEEKRLPLGLWLLAIVAYAAVVAFLLWAALAFGAYMETNY